MQTLLVIFLLFLSTDSFRPYGYENSRRIEFFCDNNEECQNFIIDSKCIQHNCKCDSDKVISSDGSKCLTPAEEYGSPCEDNSQCSKFLSTGGTCQNNKCTCKNGFHYLRGTCWKNVGLNEICTKDQQCFSAYEYIGFKCENKICKCQDEYYERLGSSCRIKRKIGESCNLDGDCQGNICENMECTANKIKHKITSYKIYNQSSNDILIAKGVKNFKKCLPGEFELNGKCVLELGMECNSNADCRHIDKAFCQGKGVCACEPVLYVASENNRKCLRVARGKVENIQKSSCQSDSQCGVFGSNGYCQNKRCACKNGTYFDQEEKFCWTIKFLEESCVNNKDCHSLVTNAECTETDSGKKCLCKSGYHKKDLECYPDAIEVGNSCEKHSDCLFPNSFCNSTNLCDCKKHYYIEKSQCKPGVGTFCIKNEDCAHLKNTECKTGDFPVNNVYANEVKQCLCKNDHTNSNSYKYCLPVADHKEICEESFQCQFLLGHLAECKGNTCQCREGAHYSHRRCHKTKFVGDSCSRIQECFPGNDTGSVICLKGFCSCNYDYELDEWGNCVKTNSGASIKFYSMLLTSLFFFIIIR